MRLRVAVLFTFALACAFDATGDGTPQETVGTTGTPPLDTSSSGVPPTDEGTSGPMAESSEVTTAPQESGETTTGSTSVADTTGEGDTTSSTSGTTGERVLPWCDPTWDDLAACYAFADLAGGVLVDDAAAGNDGSIGGIDIDGGPLGEAAIFSADSEVSVPAHAATDLSELTFELFLRIDAIPGDGRTGVIDRDGQWSLFLFADDGLRCGASAFTYWDNPTVGEWMHVGCVLGDGYARLYIDGALVSEVEAADPIDTGSPEPLAIGDNSPSFDEPVEGAISGVRIWSTTRTAEQLCEGAGDLCR